jgi:hypothetical protein
MAFGLASSVHFPHRASGPGTGGALLLETGYFILLENGGLILLEQ